MFYRRKILLALTEVVGGSAFSTDLQKLLFLFCQETQQNHYDFFPYKYGAFSFVSYYDKRKLVEQGCLKDNKQFELATNTSYLNQLKPKDRIAMQAFAAKTQNIRGQQLIRKTYLEYPKYASRSNIANTVLEPNEWKIVQMYWNKDSSPNLFTVGYEGRTIDDYLKCLTFNNISILIDVRRNPFSRKHGFSKNGMRRYLEKAGIRYVHFPELGIASHLRRNLSDRLSYEILFEQYAVNALPNQTETLRKIKGLVREHGRVALTCFEADPFKCHRYKVAEALKSDLGFDYPITHI